MADLDSIVVPLTAAIGLSVVVERVIEIGKNVVSIRVASRGSRTLPKLDGGAAIAELAAQCENARAADDHETMLEQLAVIEGRLPRAQEELAAAAGEPARSALTAEIEKLQREQASLRQTRMELPETPPGEPSERVPGSTVLVVPATDPDDGTTIRSFVLHLIGFALGIVAARAGGIHLFDALWTGVAEGTRLIPPDATLSNPVAYVFPPWLDFVLTGLFIGGGSAQMHLLLDFVSQRKVPADVAAAVSASVEAPDASMAALPLAAPAIVAPWSSGGSDDWVDIPYDGGVDVDILEGIHRRPGPPDLIVYHHTAMNSASRFEDVVRVIKNRIDCGKHWVTGYHCVVTADGVAHAFCRWDRYGNHVAGYNRRSLGISFNGNFETDPRVPYSNPDGRYGAPRPSEAQLDTGARMVAFWSLLYGIDLDFDRTIRAHRDLAQKSCPGSMFPASDFERLATYYRTKWEHSPLATDRIKAFALKPYLL
ncbi:MAG: N-acetylmuramoyl-L-alanine amidase [Gemmatimonadales bacterium]